MAAPAGNQYRSKDRIWGAAIDKALEDRGGELGRMGALVELATKLLAKCEEGDMVALKELGDRLDGKPKQVIDHGLSDQADNPIQSLVKAAEAIRDKVREAP